MCDLKIQKYFELENYAIYSKITIKKNLNCGKVIKILPESYKIMINIEYTWKKYEIIKINKSHKPVALQVFPIQSITPENKNWEVWLNC